MASAASPSFEAESATPLPVFSKAKRKAYLAHVRRVANALEQSSTIDLVGGEKTVRAAIRRACRGTSQRCNEVDHISPPNMQLIDAFLQQAEKAILSGTDPFKRYLRKIQFVSLYVSWLDQELSEQFTICNLFWIFAKVAYLDLNEFMKLAVTGMSNLESTPR